MDDINEALQGWSHRQLASLRQRSSTTCKVCEHDAEVFDVVDWRKTCDLQLYPGGLSGCPVYYFRCPDCGFVFTDFCDDFQPSDWQRLVYNEDYRLVDPDYVERRPRQNAAVIESYLSHFDRSVVGLDYGGGNGLTTDILRGKGHRFDTYDPFGRQDLSCATDSMYGFCSAFEVAEHVPDPMGFMKNLLSLVRSERFVVMIGTQVHDGLVSNESRLSWWYVAPRNGHISIYSRRSLMHLAAACGLELVSMSRSTHFMVRGYDRSFIRQMFVRAWLKRKAQRLVAGAGGAKPA
jgi:Methyltransferase domain